jgi:hypothetical protein
MLSVIILNVIMLCVVAPDFWCSEFRSKDICSKYFFTTEQHVFFTFSLIIDGATDEVLQFILPIK